MDDRDRELLKHLHRTGGADVQQLCAVLKLTRTAIRGRLQRLQAAGLLTAEDQRGARGRPRQTWLVTTSGLHALGEDYRELAVVLWDVITGIEDDTLREAFLGRVRDRLANRFRSPGGEEFSIAERLDQLAGEMKARGFNIESDHSAELPILRETTCPFPMLADVDDTICQVERQMLEQVLGTSVEFRHRCRDGHHCCEFEVQTNSQSA